jgi:hypothetical protein
MSGTLAYHRPAGKGPVRVAHAGCPLPAVGIVPRNLTSRTAPMSVSQARHSPSGRYQPARLRCDGADERQPHQPTAERQ